MFTRKLRLKMLEISFAQNLGFRNIALANYVTETARVTEPVEIHWKDRYFIGSAWVLSDRGAPLLGLLPLEYMDLMVDPVNQVLVGVHGDKELGMAMGMR